MNGMVTQLYLQADQAGDYYGESAQFSGDGFSGMHFTVHAVPPDAVRAMGRTARAGRARCWTAPAIARCRSRARTSRPSPIATVEPDLFEASSTQQLPPGPGPQPAGGGPARSPRQERMTMLGKLTWDAIPWDQPIPLIAGAVRAGRRSSRVLAWVVVKGYLPYLWREWITSVDHKRIGVMYMLLGAGDAAARLHRRDHDALAAGARLPRARLPAARALRPDLLGPRHHHDLLRARCRS